MQPGGQRDSGEGGGGGLSPAVLGMGWGAAPHTPHSSRDWTPWGHRAHGCSSVGYRGPSAPPAVGTRTPPQTPSELGIRTPTPPPHTHCQLWGQAPLAACKHPMIGDSWFPLELRFNPHQDPVAGRGEGGGTRSPSHFNPQPPPHPHTRSPQHRAGSSAAPDPPLCLRFPSPTPNSRRSDAATSPTVPPIPAGLPFPGGGTAAPPPHRSIAPSMMEAQLGWDGATASLALLWRPIEEVEAAGKCWQWDHKVSQGGRRLGGRGAAPPQCFHMMLLGGEG